VALPDAQRGVGVEHLDPRLHQVDHHQRAHQLQFGLAGLAKPPVAVVIPERRVHRPAQPVAGRAAVGVRRNPVGEDRAVDQVAVGVGGGEGRLDLGDGAQRIVRTGEVLQPVVVDAVVVQPVHRGEVAVQVGKVPVAALPQGDVDVPERLQCGHVERRARDIVTDQYQGVRVPGGDDLDQPGDLRGPVVCLQVVDDTSAYALGVGWHG